MIGAKIGVKRQSALSHKAAAGFSLIEVIVSVALFSVIIMSATQIFSLTIDSQRSALATQNVQDGLRYFLEVTAKEMRMAQKNEGVCPGIPSDQVFAVSGTDNDVLSFKNYYGQCVSYFLADDGTTRRFRVSRNTEADFISPAKIRIDRLQFLVDSGATIQPTVTINIRAYALGQERGRSEMYIQTSVASRYYK